MTMLPGATIAEIVAVTMPHAHDLTCLRVTVGDTVVPQYMWRRVRPRDGAIVAVRVIPEGSGARSILAVVVAIAAMAVGQFWLGPLIAGPAGLGLATGTTAFNAVVGVTSAALSAGASLAFNALVPLPTPQQKTADIAAQKTLYSISALRNQSTPGAPIPTILGFHRVTPTYAVPVHTEVVDDQQIVIAAFNFGHGPVELTNIRIGDEPIENFADCQVEVRYGYARDAPLTLTPRGVIEDPLSIEMAGISGAPEPASVRTSARNSVAGSIDLYFGGGLVEYDKETGDPKWIAVSVRVRYRLVGATDWTTALTVDIAGNSSDEMRRPFAWTYPAPGQYEVEVQRLSWAYPDEDRFRHKFSWSALRSYRAEYPIAYPKPLALVAVKIRASKQLNGTLDQLNADVKRICLDWDSGTRRWVMRATNNPASLFRYVLQNLWAWPIADSGIDLDDLAEWHEFCAANNLAYNKWVDSVVSVWEILREVAAAGRASPRDGSTKWSVVIDRPRAQVIAHITPRNSWGFTGERSYLRFPDAFRTTFLDEENGYESAELVVPWPGKDEADVAITEQRDVAGITNADQLFIELRRRQYEVINRPDTYTVNVGIDGLVLTRGDLAVINHHVIDSVQAAGWVRRVDGNSIHLDIEVEMEAGRGYACRFRRADGSTLLKSVMTVPGRTSVLITDGGTMPAEDDLALFGLAREESLEAIVVGIEAMENFSARLTLVDHAPQIAQLAGEIEPPAWTGDYGAPPIVVTTAPSVPVITSVLSGSGSVIGDFEVVYSAIVKVAPGSGGATPATYTVQHRLQGAGSWVTENPSPVGAGAVGLSDYVAGDIIEVRALATTSYGVSSAYSGIVTHTVLAWPAGLILREDGHYLAREDGSAYLREDA